MLIEIGGLFLNPSAITQVEPFVEARGTEALHVYFRDGSRLKVLASIDQLSRACGRVVSVAPGWRVIRAYPPMVPDESLFFDELDVLAFRLSPCGEEPAPITVEGEPVQPFAIVEPTGRAYDGEGIYETAEAYRAAMGARVNREAAALLARTEQSSKS